MVCTKDASKDVSKPLRTWSEEEEVDKLRYYNKQLHEAAFVLPNFAKVALR